MIKVGILGAAGYTGGELIRILNGHPEAEMVFLHSRSQSGKPISSVHSDLFYLDRVFDDAFTAEVDVVFLCMGHGQSKEFLASNSQPSSVKIIDLSRDFRLKEDSGDYIYGLPELNRDKIKSAMHIANPGCFATCIQLGLLPLASAGVLDQPVQVHAMTGSTGAGQKPTATGHFSWRNNNISIYKAFNHQHLDEIRQSVAQLMPSFEAPIHFVPMRGNFTRGILASLHFTTDISLDAATEMFQDYYAEHPFVIITSENPNLKQVVNTNYALIHLGKYGDQLHIISMIDNLVKGASGQAVQNMNLISDLDEKSGLNLKSVAF